MGKVVSEQELIVRCRERKEDGEKIVFVAGIFELLHPGHVRLLEQARDQGDVLVAAVLDDASAREALLAEQSGTRAINASRPDTRVQATAERKPKTDAYRRDAEKVEARGVERPVTPAAERAEILAALAAVDYAVEVGIDSLPELLAQLRPDVVVENAEPSSPTLVAEAAERAGVELVRIASEPGHSTAGIIERIVQLSGSE